LFRVSHQRPISESLTLERLLRARAAIAYAMTLDGAVYAPVFERLEREIAAVRAAEDVMARARRCLEDYAASVTNVACVGEPKTIA
jgi:histone H3/H4